MLNDDSEVPRLIQTVPRQGYRLVAPVEQVTMRQVTMPAAPLPVPPHGRRLWIAAGLVCLAAVAAVAALLLPARKTLLAVLPFENLTQRAEDASMVDGLSDELLTGIGTVEPDRLSVIGRTSVRRYRDGKANPRVRRESGGLVIEGGVRSEAVSCASRSVSRSMAVAV